MTVLFHPDFPKDVRRFQAQYANISLGLAARFNREINEAVEAIKLTPRRAGHLLRVSSAVVRELRR